MNQRAASEAPVDLRGGIRRWWNSGLHRRWTDLPIRRGQDPHESQAEAGAEEDIDQDDTPEANIAGAEDQNVNTNLDKANDTATKVNAAPVPRTRAPASYVLYTRLPQPPPPPLDYTVSGLPYFWQLRRSSSWPGYCYVNTRTRETRLLTPDLTDHFLLAQWAMCNWLRAEPLALRRLGHEEAYDQVEVEAHLLEEGFLRIVLVMVMVIFQMQLQVLAPEVD